MLNFRFSSFIRQSETDIAPASNFDLSQIEPSSNAPVEASADCEAEEAADLSNEIDLALVTLRKARSDADSLTKLVARLEVDAARVPALAEERRDLTQKLKTCDAEIIALKSENTNLRRDLDRSEKALKRYEQQCVELEQTRQQLLKSNVESRERIVVLGETVTRVECELEKANAARRSMEVEVSSLRTALSERERSVENARTALTQMRFMSVRHETRIAQLCEESNDKSEKIEDLKNQVCVLSRCNEKLQTELQAIQDKNKQLESAQSDQRISFNARISTLESALLQERTQHDITKHLLEDERRTKQVLADEGRMHKQKMVSIAQEYEQIKAELNSNLATMRDHSLRLHEANSSLTSVRDEKNRIETLLKEAQDAQTELMCKLEKMSSIEDEVAALRTKIITMKEGISEFSMR